MMRITHIAGAAAIAALLAGPAAAAGGGKAPIDMDWQFEGIFGTFDRAAAQRGLKVYQNVCSGCHALDYVAFRNLADLGFSEEEIDAIAATYTVVDGPDENGEMYERPGEANDYFPAPYANEQAARAANGGAYPPNMSLITKARANGPDYVYSLVAHGYAEAPPDDPDSQAKVDQGLSYNPYMAGEWIAMYQPLYGDDVVYDDGTEATIEQQTYDVVNFLHWAAEPKLEERKATGLKTMIFLVVITVLFYLTKRKVWSDVH